MPLYFFYTMVQKKSKMTKKSNQGGPALSSPSQFLLHFLQKKKVTLFFLANIKC